MHLQAPAGTGRFRRTAIALAVLGASATGAAQASAATIAVTAPCYVNSGKPAMIDVVGSGFTPADDVAISGTDVFVHGPAAADGSIHFITPGPLLPFIGPGQRTFALQAQDETAGTGAIATTNVTMANFSVDTQPAVAKPSRRVTWRFSGFAPGHTIYVHYQHNGRLITRMAFGRARGSCGTLKVKDRLYPGGHPHYSRYRLVFDQIKRYTRRRHLSILTTLSFF